MTFGSLLHLHFKPNRVGFTLGPGWLALMSAVGEHVPSDPLAGARLIILWLLVDPILGTLWHLFIEQPFLAAPPAAPLTTGFTLPYAQVGSWAGDIVMTVRRYQAWWQQEATFRQQGLTACTCIGLAGFLSLYLGAAITSLTLIAVSVVVLLGVYPLSPGQKGRLQATWQGLLPWAMGSIVAAPLSFWSWSLSMTVWVIYLGGLRWSSHERWAVWLFFGGQVTGVILVWARWGVAAATLAALLALSQYSLYQQGRLQKHGTPYLFLYLWAMGGLGAWLGS